LKMGASLSKGRAQRKPEDKKPNENRGKKKGFNRKTAGEEKQKVEGKLPTGGGNKGRKIHGRTSGIQLVK